MCELRDSGLVKMNQSKKIQERYAHTAFSKSVSELSQYSVGSVLSNF